MLGQRRRRWANVKPTFGSMTWDESTLPWPDTELAMRVRRFPVGSMFVQRLKPVTLTLDP